MRMYNFDKVQSSVRDMIDNEHLAVEVDNNKVKQNGDVGEKLSYLFETDAGNVLLDMIEDVMDGSFSNVMVGSDKYSDLLINKGKYLGCKMILDKVKYCIKVYDERKEIENEERE